MSLINRSDYMDKLIRYTDTDFIKVLIGVRRCGKSSLLTLYRQYLEESYGKESVLNLNFDTPEFIAVDSAEKLVEVLRERITDKSRYLLLDEVQLIPGWERVVNAYFATKQYDITITGSNAVMLSSELATHLTGRYVEIEVLPLSFKEFLTFTEKESSPKAFDEYAVFGGFPAIVLLKEDRDKIDSLKAIYDSILYNDVLKRERGLNAAMLEKIILHLNDSIGYPVSINKIVNTLKSKGYKIYYELLTRYLKILSDCELYYQTQFCFIKGRERFGLVDKYYIVDSGFLTITKSLLSENHGAVLENIVFLELKRRGYEVFVGRDGALEVDFIAKKQNEIAYFQVTESLLDSATRKREFKSLEVIEDNWPKYILSLDTHDYSQGGIINKSIIDFLMES